MSVCFWEAILYSTYWGDAMGCFLQTLLFIYLFFDGFVLAEGPKNQQIISSLDVPMINPVGIKSNKEAEHVPSWLYYNFITMRLMDKGNDLDISSLALDYQQTRSLVYYMTEREPISVSRAATALVLAHSTLATDDWIILLEEVGREFELDRVELIEQILERAPARRVFEVTRHLLDNLFGEENFGRDTQSTFLNLSHQEILLESFLLRLDRIHRKSPSRGQPSLFERLCQFNCLGERRFHDGRRLFRPIPQCECLRPLSKCRCWIGCGGALTFFVSPVVGWGKKRDLESPSFSPISRATSRARNPPQAVLGSVGSTRSANILREGGSRVVDYAAIRRLFDDTDPKLLKRALGEFENSTILKLIPNE